MRTFETLILIEFSVVHTQKYIIELSLATML